MKFKSDFHITQNMAFCTNFILYRIIHKVYYIYMQAMPEKLVLAITNCTCVPLSLYSSPGSQLCNAAELCVVVSSFMCIEGVSS